MALTAADEIATSRSGNISGNHKQKQIFAVAAVSRRYVSAYGRMVLLMRTCLVQFKMKNVADHEVLPVQKNDMAADNDVLIIGWRWRQFTHQLGRAGLDIGAQAWRQSSVDYQLTFQARRQPVFLREAGR